MENMRGKDEEYILKMEKITKIYSNGFAANKEVDFFLRRGEIHALAGENGAGKSTLMKVLFGEEKPDEGSIYYKGERVSINSPITAIKMGIGMVHQHFMLVPSMTVAENIVLGMEPGRLGMLNREEAVKKTKEIAQKYGLDIDPHVKVSDLSVGSKQRVEILKALLRGADILILDEPTAVLTPQETKEIFEELKNLRKMGHTVVFISHKLNEIKEICDRITIMRDGRTVAVKEVSEVSEQEIAGLMVGRSIQQTFAKKPVADKKKRLDIQDVCRLSPSGKMILDHLSFYVQSGEILGVAGIEGNGQNELSEIITGMSRDYTGNVTVNDQSIAKKSVRRIREMQVSHISQDRMTYGISADAGIEENIIADRYYKRQYKRFGCLLDKKKIRKETNMLIKDFSVKCDDAEQPVKMLSGGNIQKVVVAREFSNAPQVIIANQPTRGIDVGAAELIHNKLIELRDSGVAILLISADLSEIIHLSDRIIVLHKGRLAAHFENAESVTPEILGEYMLGLKEMK